MKSAARFVDARCNSAEQMSRSRLQLAKELLGCADGRFRRGGWRWCAMIGHEVADRDVDLVANGGNRWNGTARECARDAFVVECPEILAGSAASADDDRVRAIPAAHLINGKAELLDGGIALRRCGNDDEPDVRGAALDDGHDVVERRAVRARDDGYDSRIARQRTLALRREQPVGLELGPRV